MPEAVYHAPGQPKCRVCEGLVSRTGARLRRPISHPFSGQAQVFVSAVVVRTVELESALGVRALAAAKTTLLDAALTEAALVTLAIRVGVATSQAGVVLPARAARAAQPVASWSPSHRRVPLGARFAAASDSGAESAPPSEPASATGSPSAEPELPPLSVTPAALACEPAPAAESASTPVAPASACSRGSPVCTLLAHAIATRAPQMASREPFVPHRVMRRERFKMWPFLG